MFLARPRRSSARLAAATFAASSRALQAEPVAAAEPPAAVADWDPPQYERIGTVAGKYAVERKPVFAVVEIGPTQFKVSPDDLVYSEKLTGAPVLQQAASAAGFCSAQHACSAGARQASRQRGLSAPGEPSRRLFAGVGVNDRLALSRVLMLGTQTETVIGRPFVPHARVTAAVEVGACPRSSCAYQPLEPVHACCKQEHPHCPHAGLGCSACLPVAPPRCWPLCTCSNSSWPPCVHQTEPARCVQEQTLDAKVIIFHKRRRKNSRKTKGHRQVRWAARACGDRAGGSPGPRTAFTVLRPAPARPLGCLNHCLCRISRRCASWTSRRWRPWMRAQQRRPCSTGLACPRGEQRSHLWAQACSLLCQTHESAEELRGSESGTGSGADSGRL